MNICVQCGVELEDDMASCPLCGTPAGTDPQKQAFMTPDLKVSVTRKPEEKALLQSILWQVTSILLLSGIVATLIIDISVHRAVTWSVYPVTVCMIIFSYASVSAFWDARKIYQILAGFLISSVLLVGLHLLMRPSSWPLQLGLPLLVALNFISILFVVLVSRSNHRGLNVIAYTCVSVAVLCISIEAVLSIYHGDFVLQWSIIVAACLLPVTAALLFMYHRIKGNPEMEKIFHT